VNVFRVRFDVAGGHVHCSLFCAPRSDHTFAKCGDFVVRKGPEFVDLMHAFQHVEFKAGGNGTMQEAIMP